MHPYNFPVRFPLFFLKRAKFMMSFSRFRKLFFIFAVSLVVAGASRSAEGGYQEGVDAYRRGDYAAAMKEWKPLAEQGNEMAQLVLADLYQRGKGVKKNYPLAAKWYRKSAEQGHPDAQLNLGFMYYLGEGVPKDLVLAFMWLNISVINENKIAEQNRDKIKKLMTPEQMLKGHELSKAWLDKHKKK